MYMTRTIKVLSRFKAYFMCINITHKLQQNAKLAQKMKYSQRKKNLQIELYYSAHYIVNIWLKLQKIVYTKLWRNRFFFAFELCEIGLAQSSPLQSHQIDLKCSILYRKNFQALNIISFVEFSWQDISKLNCFIGVITIFGTYPNEYLLLMLTQL